MIGWRRLPIPLAPAQHETLASWLHRLAAVHGLATAELRRHLRIGPHVGGPDELRDLARRLAAVTGYPADRLARALPELRVPPPDWQSLRHLAQRACPRCTARHQGGPVRRLFAHHEYLCARHGYWIGPPDPTRDDPPLRLGGRLPDLVAAQHRLRRTDAGTAGRLPSTPPPQRPASASTCASAPSTIPCGHVGNGAWTCVMPAGYRRSLFIAAIYPEVCALAVVLAATDWHAPAPADPARRRPPHQPGRAGDGRQLRPTPCRDQLRPVDLAQHPRLPDHCSGRPATYPETSHHDDGTPRVTDVQRHAEQGTANRFARDRRAPRTHSRAAPLPYAHRPAAAAASPGRPR